MHLKRCFLFNRFIIKNKKLSVIHLHLSAYGSKNLQEKQLELIKDFIKEESTKTDSIILVGDWNIILNNTKFKYTDKNTWNPLKVNLEQKFSGFKLVAPSNLPTARLLNSPYQAGKNPVYIIDGFLISQNLEVEEIKTLNENFRYSDHNPVYAVLKWKD